ncbi:MAG: hypothetical protein ACXVEE_27565, partial [Polyangiales bacterium]
MSNAGLRRRSLRPACVLFALYALGRTSIAHAQTEPAAPPPPPPDSAKPEKPLVPSEGPREPPGVSKGTPAGAEASAVPPGEKASEPFAFGDFTWLNGSSRQKK